MLILMNIDADVIHADADADITFGDADIIYADVISVKHENC